MKYKDLRPSHLQMFAHISFEGISIVELASKLNISKQAVSKMANDLLNAGVLIKKTIPRINAHFLSLLIRKKNAGIHEGMKHLKSVDEMIVSLFGDKKSKILLKQILEIIHFYEEKGP